MNVKPFVFLAVLMAFSACKEVKEPPVKASANQTELRYAKGFTLSMSEEGITTIRVSSPWPNAQTSYTYALIPKERLTHTELKSDAYDAIIGVPVSKMVVTSTTHIPALEALEVEEKLVGFPETKYISSPRTRTLIDRKQVKELGSNETINTELALELSPEVVIGFSINNQNKTYETLQRSGIPVVYNGDWTEETPLGKAEWIKFFAPFFGKQQEADSIFKAIETSYLQAKALATKAQSTPTVLSGALYKDVWYSPGGNSWAAQFLRDANARYLWGDTEETGSLSLSLEEVLDKGKEATIWVSPSQYSGYQEMETANRHYKEFTAFKDKKVYTFAKTKGVTGGLLYYELAPNRPDLVLKDLIHIFHPNLLPNYQTTFFKPLD